MPKGLSGIGRQVNEVRRRIEAQLIERDGEVKPAFALRLRTACTMLRLAARCERRLGEDGLTHEQWLALADRVQRLSEAADRAIVKLGVDKPPDPWAALHASQLQTPADDDPEATEAHPDASNADCGGFSGERPGLTVSDGETTMESI